MAKRRTMYMIKSDSLGFELERKVAAEQGLTEVFISEALFVEFREPGTPPIIITPPPATDPGPTEPPTPPPTPEPGPQPVPWWSLLVRGNIVKISSLNTPVYYDPADEAAGKDPWNTLNDWREMSVFSVKDDWVQVWEYTGPNTYNLWVRAKYLSRVS